MIDDYKYKKNILYLLYLICIGTINLLMKYKALEVIIKYCS